jgi:hypothetical protein
LRNWQTIGSRQATDTNNNNGASENNILGREGIRVGFVEAIYFRIIYPLGIPLHRYLRNNPVKIVYHTALKSADRQDHLEIIDIDVHIQDMIFGMVFSNTRP